MEYGDIVIYKKQVGTVVKSENEFKFLPCNYGRCYFSDLDTITDEDVREADHIEKLGLIEKEFAWGVIKDIHSIGDYQIVEYIDQKDKNICYHGYVDYKDTNESYSSLDSALVGCIGYKYEGRNGRAAMYFEKMIGLK